jgi:hypothetical protein
VAAGVVVLDLVVVPGRHERVAGVGGLQVGVGLVEGVPDAVAGKVGRLGADVAANQARPRAVLVDVVPEVQDHVEVLLGQVPVGGVVAALPALAAHHGERETLQRRPWVGAGLGPSEPAGVAAGAEPVPVVAAGCQPVDLDVDGVAGRRCGDHPAPGDHIDHAGAGGDLPVDRHGQRRHAAVRVKRPWRQAGPEHHPGRGRVAGGDAEVKGSSVAARGRPRRRESGR